MATVKQNLTFGSIVDVIYGLPLEDRLELKSLLEHNIIETKRAEILQNGKDAKKAEKNKELVFTADIDTLKKIRTRLTRF